MLSFWWVDDALTKEGQATYRVSFPQEIESYWEDEDGRWVRFEGSDEQHQVFGRTNDPVFGGFSPSSMLDEYSTEDVTLCYEDGCWAMLAEESRNRSVIQTVLGAQVRWPD